MDWWNDLWLNESFATWVGWLATDHLFPEYNVWSRFVAESLQSAFNLDGLRSSHPVEVVVRSALDINQIFDAISYLKGSSVIRMLSAHLGVETFLKGVSSYLKKHAYGNVTTLHADSPLIVIANAKTNDLWAALSEASGKDVVSFIDPWIRNIGFPVLTVAEEPGQLGLRQSRFLLSGDVKPDEDKTIWWIPTGLKTANGFEASSKALTEKEETLREVDETFYKLNVNQVGFYRTNYPPARLVKLGQESSKFSVEDRIGVVADAAAIAIAGQGTTAGLLTLVENFQGETNYFVWSQILSSLANSRSIFADSDAISEGLKAFTLRLISPATEKIGWEPAAGENYLDGQLRALLIKRAGGAGHQK